MRLTLKSTLAAAALLLAAPGLFASWPGARTDAQMVYVPTTTRTVMFGGATLVDSGTKQAYQLDRTWEWTGINWVRRYPAQSPPGRSAFSMVYDSNADRVIIFGGEIGTSLEGNDTWFYKDNQWTQFFPAQSPPARDFAGAAFDPVRTRIVMFGGSYTTILNQVATVNDYYDTWEFDGSNWTQVQATGPQVLKATLVYDQAHHKILMLGIDVNGATQMYEYNPSPSSWTQIK